VVAVIGTEPADAEPAVTEQGVAGEERSPRHLLTTGLLGRPKHGQERVSDLAARHDDPSADSPPGESSDDIVEEEHVT
jgi:hypothetical protein